MAKKKTMVVNKFRGRVWILILLLLVFGPFGLLYLLYRGPVEVEVTRLQ